MEKMEKNLLSMFRRRKKKLPNQTQQAVIPFIIFLFLMNLLIPICYATNVYPDSIQSPDDSIFPVAEETTPGTVTMVSVATEGTDQIHPAIWEDRIVWADFRNFNDESGSFQSDIYLYNISTGKEYVITSTPEDEFSPDIFGNIIVWVGYDPIDTDFEIFYTDIQDGTILRLTDDFVNQLHPKIWGNYIIWQEGDEALDDEIRVVLYNLENGEDYVVSGQSTYALFPDIWEDRVVWQDGRNGIDFDIYLYNISSSTEEQITSDPAHQTMPSIWEDIVVWQDIRDGISQIYACIYPEKSSTRITSDQSPAEYPLIGENFISYIQMNEGYPLILIDRISGTSRVISDNNSDYSLNSDLWKGRVVWQNYRDDGMDIFLYSAGVFLPDLVCDFIQNTTLGEPPLSVEFSDMTQGEPEGWNWDFGDGTSSEENNPVHSYDSAGVYTVILTVHSPYQRSAIRKSDLISVGSVPVPKFSQNMTSGPASLILQFFDESSGLPTTWNWDFGDGEISNEQNPVHIFTLPGIYSIQLTASNIFGNATVTKEGLITVVDRTFHECILPSDGITITSEADGNHLILNISEVGTCAIHTDSDQTFLSCIPSPGSGIAELQFLGVEGTPFSYHGNDSITGTFGEVILQSVDMYPHNFTQKIGNNSYYNLTLSMGGYAPPGSIRSTAWEGCTPDDLERFNRIKTVENYASIEGLAYTLQFSEEGIPTGTPATLFFAVSSDWVRQYGWGDNRSLEIDSVPQGARVYVDTIYAGTTPVIVGNLSPGPHEILLSRSGYETKTLTMEVRDERDSIHVIRIGDDGSGEVLNTTFIGHDPERNLDFFRAESPHGLSTFGLASLSKSGNVFQMIYLMISSVVGGGSSGGGSTGGNPEWLAAAVKTPTPVTTPVQDSRLSPLPTVTSTGDGRTTGTPVPDPTDTIPDGRDPGINPPGVAPWGPATLVLLKNLSVVSVVILVTVVFYLRWKRT